MDAGRSAALRRLLEALRGRVARALEERLPPVDEPPERLHEAMRYAVLGGGKRVRAALVYVTGEAFGARPAALEPPACAVELIHAYSLVHDDLPVMDDDDLRRGRPTCHRAFDEATALLAGDALQTLAFEVLGRAAGTIGARRVADMVRLLAFAAGSRGMAGGQALDLAAVGRRLGLPELEDMHRRKTGALIRASVGLGLAAAGARTAEVAERLDRYAACLGLAFQIQDDILDVVGDPELIGKPAGSDEAQGKPTYPSLLGLEESRALAGRLHEAALEALAPFGASLDPLRWLSEFVVTRAH